MLSYVIYILCYICYLIKKYVNFNLFNVMYEKQEITRRSILMFALPLHSYDLYLRIHPKKYSYTKIYLFRSHSLFV